MLQSMFSRSQLQEDPENPVSLTGLSTVVCNTLTDPDHQLEGLLCVNMLILAHYCEQKTVNNKEVNCTTGNDQ